jgi:selT/selW/selH-like putative selenoprotein
LAELIQQRTGAVPVLQVGAKGAFEVLVDGRLVFSKLKENRFPDPSEILPHVPK